MNKTDIEWCDMTWNPITGCLHECEYCYACLIARRFGGGEAWDRGSSISSDPRLHVLFTKPEKPFPFYFEPTLHSYRSDQPAKIKTPKNIFVGSMADCFGSWVPDEWITKVFEACTAAPQHRYLFLTKNPARYTQPEIHNFGNEGTNALHHKYPENWWFGTTVTNQAERDLRLNRLPFYKNCFVSIEPLHEEIPLNPRALRNAKYIKWVIIGAESGRKPSVVPRREWIVDIVDACRTANVPVFLKNNLADIWGQPLIQEYPWEVTA